MLPHQCDDRGNEAEYRGKTGHGDCRLSAFLPSHFGGPDRAHQTILTGFFAFTEQRLLHHAFAGGDFVDRALELRLVDSLDGIDTGRPGSHGRGLEHGVLDVARRSPR